MPFYLLLSGIPIEIFDSITTCKLNQLNNANPAIIFLTNLSSVRVVRLVRLVNVVQHTVPAQKLNIIKKMSVGKSLTFSFIMIIRRLLLFARLSYYFTEVWCRTGEK